MPISRLACENYSSLGDQYNVLGFTSKSSKKKKVVSHKDTKYTYEIEKRKKQKQNFIDAFQNRDTEEILIEGHLPKESRVAKLLIDRITKITILVVLGMMLILPLLGVDMYYSNAKSCEDDIDYLKTMKDQGYWTRESQYIAFYDFLKLKYAESINPLYSVKMYDYYSWTDPGIVDLRNDELIECAYTIDGDE